MRHSVREDAIQHLLKKRQNYSYFQKVRTEQQRSLKFLGNKMVNVQKAVLDKPDLKQELFQSMIQRRRFMVPETSS